jgi:hypothetical protein
VTAEAEVTSEAAPAVSAQASTGVPAATEHEVETAPAVVSAVEAVNANIADVASPVGNGPELANVSPVAASEANAGVNAETSTPSPVTSQRDPAKWATELNALIEERFVKPLDAERLQFLERALGQGQNLETADEALTYLKREFQSPRDREIVACNYNHDVMTPITLGFLHEPDQTLSHLLHDRKSLSELVKQDNAYPYWNKGTPRWRMGRDENLWTIILTERTREEAQKDPLPTLQEYLSGQAPIRSERRQSVSSQPEVPSEAKKTEIDPETLKLRSAGIARLMRQECLASPEISPNERETASHTLAGAVFVWKNLQTESLDEAFNDLVAAELLPDLARQILPYGRKTAAEVVKSILFEKDGATRPPVIAATRIELVRIALKNDPSAKSLIEAARRSISAPHMTREGVIECEKAQRRFIAEPPVTLERFSKVFGTSAGLNPVGSAFALIKDKFAESDHAALRKIFREQAEQPPTQEQRQLLSLRGKEPESRLEASLQMLGSLPDSRREQALQRWIDSLRVTIGRQSEGVVWAAEMRRPAAEAEVNRHAGLLDRISETARQNQAPELSNHDRRLLAVVLNDHDRFGLYPKPIADPLRDCIERPAFAEKMQRAGVRLDPADSRLGVRMKLLDAGVVTAKQAFNPYLALREELALKPEVLNEGESLTTAPEGAPPGRALTPNLSGIKGDLENAALRVWAVPGERIFDMDGKVSAPPPREITEDYKNLQGRVSEEERREFLLSKGYDAFFQNERLVVLDDKRAVLWMESQRIEDLETFLQEPADARRERLAGRLAGLAELAEAEAAIARAKANSREETTIVTDRDGVRMTREGFLNALRHQAQTETMQGIMSGKFAPGSALEMSRARYAELESQFSSAIAQCQKLEGQRAEEGEEVARKAEARAAQLKEVHGGKPIFNQSAFEEVLRKAAESGPEKALTRLQERLADRDNYGIGQRLSDATRRTLAVNALLALTEVTAVTAQVKAEGLARTGRAHLLPESVCEEWEARTGQSQRNWTLEEISVAWLSAREVPAGSETVKAAENLQSAWVEAESRFSAGLESHLKELVGRAQALTRIADQEGVAIGGPEARFTPGEMTRLTQLVQKSGYDPQVLRIWETCMEKPLDEWKRAAAAVTSKYGADAKRAGVELINPDLIWRLHQEAQHRVSADQAQLLEAKGLPVPGNRLEARLALDANNGSPWSSFKEKDLAAADSPLETLNHARALTAAAYVERKVLSGALKTAQSPCVNPDPDIFARTALERIAKAAENHEKPETILAHAKLGIERSAWTEGGGQSPAAAALRRIAAETAAGAGVEGAQQIARHALDRTRASTVRGAELIAGTIRYGGKEWALSPTAAKKLDAAAAAAARTSVQDRLRETAAVVARLEASEGRTKTLMGRIVSEVPSLEKGRGVAPVASAIQEGAMRLCNPKILDWTVQRLAESSPSSPALSERRRPAAAVEWSLEETLAARRAVLMATQSVAENRRELMTPPVQNVASVQRGMTPPPPAVERRNQDFSLAR